MGPIQTSLNRLLGMAAAGAVAGKKYLANEEQVIQATVNQRTQEAIAGAEATEQEEQEAKAKAEQLKADKQEAAAVATEADIRNLGGSELAARAYRLAQERGLADPKRIIYDEAGKPVATYEEMATLLADTSLSGTLSAKLRSRQAVKTRKDLLKGKTHKERVENALLSVGGGKK